jgi:hypothetical protein
VNERVAGAVYMAKGKQRWEKEAVWRCLLPKEEGRRRDTRRGAGRRHDGVRRRLRHQRENETKEGENKMKTSKNT